MTTLRDTLTQLASPERAQNSRRFFKTGKGEYGEGDSFLGITVPQCRVVAKKFIHLTLEDIKKSLASKDHEERLVSLFILTEKFTKTDEKGRKELYEFYLKHKEHVNNWDLVDSSASQLVGTYLLDKEASILDTLANSSNLWDRRIAIVSTYAFIKQGKFSHTVRIAEKLLKDKEDLIQKATGWMLREMGKKDIKVLEEFLRTYAKTMPRTMLRYAIEKFPQETRKRYLRGELV